MLRVVAGSQLPQSIQTGNSAVDYGLDCPQVLQSRGHCQVFIRHDRYSTDLGKKSNSMIHLQIWEKSMKMTGHFWVSYSDNIKQTYFFYGI